MIDVYLMKNEMKSKKQANKGLNIKKKWQWDINNKEKMNKFVEKTMNELLKMNSV